MWGSKLDTKDLLDLTELYMRKLAEGSRQSFNREETDPFGSLASVLSLLVLSQEVLAPHEPL